MKCIIVLYYVHPYTKRVQCLLTSWGDVFYVNTAQCKHVMVIFLPKTLSPHVETYCYEHQFGVLQAISSLMKCACHLLLCWGDAAVG